MIFCVEGIVEGKKPHKTTPTPFFYSFTVKETWKRSLTQKQ